MPASQDIPYGPYNGIQLHVEVQPEQKKDFYFSDEKPTFHVLVENIGSVQFDDDLWWFVSFPGNRETEGLCSVNLGPGENGRYSVGGKLLGFPGTAALCLKIPTQLPIRGPVRGLGGPGMISPSFHTLYTFEVYDRALYKREQNEKWILRLGVIIGFLTLIAVILFGLTN